PLEEMAREKSEAAVRLYAPRTGYRLPRGGRVFITYDLKTAPKDTPKIALLGPDGKVLNEIEGPKNAGQNRKAWDLDYEAPRLIQLRTTPPENPHVWEELRFRG